MFGADRRIQEGTRDLALAFMLGRAEEALSRLSGGHSLDSKERLYFEQLLNLFADALEGYSWATSNASTPAPSVDSLRAVELVMPAVQEASANLPVEALLRKLSSTARSLANESNVPEDDRSVLQQTLKRLASLAAGQGRETLDSETPPPMLPALRTRLL